jgi:hypothetical protein
MNSPPFYPVTGREQSERLALRACARGRRRNRTGRASRLRDFGVASEIICPYVNVESAALVGFCASPKRNALRRIRGNNAAMTATGQHYRHRASFAAGSDVGALPAWAGSTREFTTTK